MTTLNRRHLLSGSAALAGAALLPRFALAAEFEFKIASDTPASHPCNVRTLEACARIKEETGILTGAVGLITTPAEAETIVASGQADLVLLAREFLREPYFPLFAAQDLGAEVEWPAQYERAKPRVHTAAGPR